MREQEALARIQELEAEVDLLKEKIKSLTPEEQERNWQISWTETHYSYNQNFGWSETGEEEHVVATFDTREAAEEFLESCKTKAYRDNPNLYFSRWQPKRFFYQKSPLAGANGNARIEKYDPPEAYFPPPHNPPIDCR